MTFDQAADLYQRARPDCPDALFDRLIEVTGLEHGSRLLEIGCATGKATVPLAKRGMRITCIELGPARADVARVQLRDPFCTEIQQVYEEIGEGHARDAACPVPGELPDRRAEIEASGLVEVVDIHNLAWEVTYDVDGYIDLLNSSERRKAVSTSPAAWHTRPWTRSW